MRCPVFALAAFLTACGGDTLPPLVATDVVVTRPLPGSHMSAGYMSLTNNSDSPIRITAVTSAEYGAVELHESRLEAGISKMRRLEFLEIPPDATISLAKGGKHLMLMRAEGKSEKVSLNFYNEDALLLTVNADLPPGDN